MKYSNNITSWKCILFTKYASFEYLDAVEKLLCLVKICRYSIQQKLATGSQNEGLFRGSIAFTLHAWSVIEAGKDELMTSKMRYTQAKYQKPHFWKMPKHRIPIGLNMWNIVAIRETSKCFSHPTWRTVLRLRLLVHETGKIQPYWSNRISGSQSHP